MRWAVALVAVIPCVAYAQTKAPDITGMDLKTACDQHLSDNSDKILMLSSQVLSDQREIAALREKLDAIKKTSTSPSGG